MKSLRIICILFLALALAGCSWWSKGEPEKTADELVADGRMYFEKEKYSEAIKSYKKLRDWYPFSSHAKEAGLIIADAHYRMEEYDEAILAYSEYESMHPNDAKIPYVIYQTGMCDYDRIETIDRDATATRNALRTFQRLTEAFPDSDYAQKAKPLIKTCLENLAAKEMDIALFYFKMKKYAAALKRFDGVVTTYPDFGLHHQALDYMAKCKAMIEKEQEGDDSGTDVSDYEQSAPPMPDIAAPTEPDGTGESD